MSPKCSSELTIYTFPLVERNMATEKSPSSLVFLSGDEPLSIREILFELGVSKLELGLPNLISSRTRFT